MKKKFCYTCRYIPGLNQASDPGVASPKIYKSKSDIPKQVPKDLVVGFLNGSKHPVSALMEYAAMVKLVVTFHEANVENPSIIAKFACVCAVNGKQFPQGNGKTKKDAKTVAAKIAFTALLGVEEDDVDDDKGECCHLLGIYD